ncbi:uncharacterized protein JCM15063_004706 [Sporobolomyces koalae]|uniref:uncharacterized protein n=1 Tax=Sporobolomyces koalae TaxID=500713 RepID=UPI00317D126F
MPTTIRHLPFEILEQILDAAAGEADLDSKPSIISRYAWLRSTALVSRDFRHPAQSCLWKVLRVHSPETAKRLLNSKCLKCYGTRELSLEGVHSGSDGLSGSTAARVLSKVVGVRTLKIMDFGRLSLKCLSLDNLSTLRTLYLMSSFPDKSTTINSLSFPFHLRTLHLFNRSYSSNLLPTLFDQCSRTLASLTLITSHSSSSYPALVSAFPLVAPNLVHLSLQHRPSQDLIDTFALCTRLSSLECTFAVNLATVLDALPHAQLKHLSIELDYNLVDVAQVLVTRLDSSTLAQLEVLKIPRAPAKEEFREFGGQDMLDACAERGIRVELGQVVAWRTRSVFD